MLIYVNKSQEPTCTEHFEVFPSDQGWVQTQFVTGSHQLSEGQWTGVNWFGSYLQPCFIQF